MANMKKASAFGAGAGVGALGGLIGLGGAEFRLPILISIFRFGALEAVIINKATSLIVVAAALVFRAKAVPLSAIADHWPIVANLLAGSLLGAWVGAGWATRMKSGTLFRVIAIMLVLMAAALMFSHNAHAATTQPLFHGWALITIGVAAGVGIGVVAALLGVAGGELLIPTIVLLFGADIRLAGSLSLAISLPTMIVGFARYSQDKSFIVLRNNRSFMLFLAAGSVVGAFIGGLLLGIVPSTALIPLLAVILLVSALKVWTHQ